MTTMDCLHPSIFLHVTFRTLATPLFIGACLIAALGNTFCLVVLRQPSQQTKYSKFLISLALSDCLLGYISFPMAIWLLQNASRSPGPLATQCLVERVYISFTYWTFGSSSISIIFIAYDRFLLITKPSQHKKILPDRKIFYIILAYWVLAFIFAVVLWINIYLFVLNGLLLQVTPTLLLCTSYYYVMKAVKNSRKRINMHTDGKTRHQNNTYKDSSDCIKSTKNGLERTLKQMKKDENQYLGNASNETKTQLQKERSENRKIKLSHFQDKKNTEDIEKSDLTKNHDNEEGGPIRVMVKSYSFPGTKQTTETTIKNGATDNMETTRGETSNIKQHGQSIKKKTQTCQEDKRTALDGTRKKARTHNREKKLARKVTTLILFYLIAVLPGIMIYILTFAAFLLDRPSPGFGATPYVISFGVFCALSNSAVNPAIYIQNDPEFRRACKMVIRRIRDTIRN